MGVASATEAYFVFAVGLLLSLNSGYINGLCLSGLLTEGGSVKQGVSAFTGTYTKSGLVLANGDVKLFGFEFTLILAFIGGAMVAGLMNPKAIPHKLVPSYGPTFILGSCCMIAASIAAELHPSGRTLFYFAAMANGIQNGMTSTYSANLIRTSHLTGTSTDIGLIIGQMLRGNWKNYWKFKVLVGLASSFWLGSVSSFYSATQFLSHSLWFSAGLYLLIGLTHLTFVVLTQKVSFVQACVGTWKWDRVLEHMATSMTNESGNGREALAALTPDKVDHAFDQIDSDGSGEIDADELKVALEKMGIKLTSKNVMTMIAVVDENGDGVVDREEFHTLVSMATLRAVQKQQSKMKRKTRIRSSTNIRNSEMSSRNDRIDDVSSSANNNSVKSFPGKESLVAEHKKKQCQSAEEGTRQLLPRTYQEALPPEGGDNRAIIVTEAKYPFAVVGVNEPWEDLCGYKAKEARDKSMSNLIQGPRTNCEGLKQAMDQLKNGAEHVECNTVNYRKDGSMFNNHLIMGPLYDEEGRAAGDVEEDGERQPSHYVGILMNIGELAQDMSAMEENEEKVVDFEDNEPNPVKPENMV